MAKGRKQAVPKTLLIVALVGGIDRRIVVRCVAIVGCVARPSIGYAPDKIKHSLYRRAYKIYKRVGRPLPPVLQNIEEINFTAVKDYVPQTYSRNVMLFLASDLTADYDLHDGWRELIAGEIEAHEIPGNHINIIKEPHVGALAEKLRSCLDQAQQNHPVISRAA